MLLPIEIMLANLRKITGVTTVTKVPSRTPDLFVRVTSAAPHLASPAHEQTGMTVQVYGRDLERVLETLRVARNYLEREIYAANPQVAGWQEVSGPMEFPDPDIEEDFYRWQFSGELTTFFSP